MRRVNGCKLLNYKVRFISHVSTSAGGCLLTQIDLPMRLDHPFFAGLQAHPEFCTRPLNPSPAYLGFIAAAASADLSVLREQIIRQKNYVPPHPDSHLKLRVATPAPSAGTQKKAFEISSSELAQAE